MNIAACRDMQRDRLIILPSKGLICRKCKDKPGAGPGAPIGA